jgi:hypothetical protein
LTAISLKGEVVEFEVVSEKWSVYNIKDRVPVPLKARLILTKVIRADMVDSLGQPIYATGESAPTFVTFAPPSIRGPPTIPPPTPEQMNQAIVENLEVEPVDEPWNEYRLKDGTIIRQKIVVTGAVRTSLFALDGDPLYVINHQTIGRTIIPPELRRSKAKKSPANAGRIA